MVCGFTQCNITVMAGCTITGYAAMIKYAGSKSAGCMAYSTIFRGIYMIIGLTGCANAMTRIAAVTHYIRTGMINKLFGKSSGIVAITAIRSGIRVNWC